MEDLTWTWNEAREAGVLPDEWLDLRGANLVCANLHLANLRHADLRGADLRSANLFRANLRCADLRGAQLTGANLFCADLSHSDLSDADLYNTNLTCANLSGAIGIPSYVEEALLVVPREGAFEGFKKARRIDNQEECIVHLRIPADAYRSNATSRECRSDFADVLEIIGAPEGVGAYTGDYGPYTEYHVGKRVHADTWDEDRWAKCTNGIHFFLTLEEAEKWNI